MAAFISTVTPTICGGTVVRWYFSGDPHAGEPHVEPALSASRHGVRIGTFLHLVPVDLLDKANAAHFVLKSNPDADMSGWATHQHERTFGGSLVPIVREEATDV